ncbi:MAG: glycosyltransferase [Anaerolineales bacterium]
MSGKPVAYELDDLLLELPLEHPEKQFYDEARSQMLEAVAEADAVVASTQRIADYLRQFNPRTWLLPNYLDDRLWSFREAKGDDSPYVVVGYMGGRTQTHIPDLESITPVLTRLLDAYPGRLQLRFWGTFPSELEDHPNVDFRTKTHANYASFAEYFSLQDCDVFVAPLTDNLFNRSKSWIKFLEYSSLAIPGVYSRLTPYENVVVHGENGFLASTHEEWEANLRRLIDNRGLRLSMGRAAQDMVRRRMLLSKHAHEWGTVYRTIHSSAKRRRSSVRRQVLAQQLRKWESEQDATSDGVKVARGAGEVQESTSIVPEQPHASSRLRLLARRGLLVIRREGPLAFSQAVIRRFLALLAIRRKYRRNGSSSDAYGIDGGRRELDPGSAPIVSIAIPVLNGLEFVGECIDSILDSPVSLRSEIVVIDQGSRDGTLKLLRNLAESHPNILLVENKSNIGFGPAVNQAAAVARGEFIAILNSDVIVTPGWLDKLVEPLREDPTLGITSPVTNYVGEGPQIDPNARNVTPQDAAIYAQEISHHEGLEPVVDRLVFFCVVVRKKTFDYLGGLATVFGLGNYEDEDFCLRLRMAGFSLGIVPGSFVFHYGSRTFKEQNVDHTALMLRNEKIYFERVNTFATQQPFLANRPAHQDPPVASVVVRTKDRPQLLKQALASLANQTANAFEVVVVNDGGVDVSSVVSAFSPHLTLNYVEHDRPKGRAPALNTGLASARGRWITYLDDDDIVYPTHLEHLMGALTKDDGYKVAYSDVNKALCWSDLRSDQVLERAYFSRKAYDPKALLVENWIPIMSLMHSADCVQDVGGFDDSLQIFEDWDFLIRLSRAYEFRHMPRITCEYRFRFGDVGEDTTLQSRENALETMLLIHNRYPTADKRTQDLRAIAVDASRQIIQEMRLIDVTDGTDLDRKLLATARLGGFSMASTLDFPYWPLSPINPA